MPTAIDRQLLVKQLRRTAPDSGLAAYVEQQSEGDKKLTKDALDGAVQSYGALSPDHALTTGEQKALQSVYRVFGAKPLFDIVESLPSRDELAVEKIAPRRQRVPAAALKLFPFSTPVASRIAEPLSEMPELGKWTTPAKAHCTGIPTPSPDARLLFVFDLEGRLSTYSTQNGDVLWSLELGSQGFASPLVSPDGSTVYLTTGDSPAQVIAVDVEERALRWKTELAKGVGAIQSTPALSPDGQFLYVPNTDGYISKLDTWKGKELWREPIDLPGMGGLGSVAAAVSPDGSKLVLRGDKHLACFDTEERKPLWQVPMSNWTSGSPAFSLDGKVVYATSAHSLRALDVELGRIKWDRDLPLAGRSRVPVLSRDDKTLYIGSGASLVTVDVSTGRNDGPPIMSPLPSGFTGAIALTADESRAYAVDVRGAVIQIDLKNRKAVALPAFNESIQMGFSVSPDARYLYEASGAGNARTVRSVELG